MSTNKVINNVKKLKNVINRDYLEKFLKIISLKSNVLN